LFFKGLDKKPLKNAHFCSRKEGENFNHKNIFSILRIKFEPDTEIGPKGAFCKGLDKKAAEENMNWLIRTFGSSIGKT